MGRARSLLRARPHAPGYECPGKAVSRQRHRQKELDVRRPPASGREKRDHLYAASLLQNPQNKPGAVPFQHPGAARRGRRESLGAIARVAFAQAWIESNPEARVKELPTS